MFSTAVRSGTRPASFLAVLAVALVAGPARAAISEEPVRTGLSQPAAFTFDPEGRVFYGERFTGRIKIFDPVAGGASVQFFQVSDVVDDVEQGLLGIAVHPRYPRRPFVYVYATRSIGDEAWNQLIRIRASDDVGQGMKVLLQSRVGSTGHHNGGRILFGPDGNLYVVIGEAFVPSNAQDLSNVKGKILRMTPTGEIPADNPFPGKYIYAYGIRNSFGLAFDPTTGALWGTEAGPSCNDELNRYRRGGNHGWGSEETCSTSDLKAPYNTNQSGPDPIILPKAWYTPVITPTGVVFCERCRLGHRRDGRLYFGSWNDDRIREVVLSDTRRRVVEQRVVLYHGRSVLSMERAPDGTIYFSDSGGIHRLVRAS
jgi:glucose/arabinose dehydrogenase